MKEKIEKIKKYIIKYDEFFVTLSFFVLILGNALWICGEVGDELWDFNNIYKMYNGYKLYVDINVITTPLYHCIGLLIFKVLGANFFALRIYNSMIFTIIFLGVYKIFKALNIRKKDSLILTLLMFIINITKIQDMATYTDLAIAFYIFAILVLLKKEKYKHYILIESALIVLVLLTKQNIGALYILGLIIYYFLNIKDIKELLKILGITGLFSTAFLLILKTIGNLEEFIDLCVLGIREFAQKNITVGEKEILFLLLITFINISLIVLLNKSKDLKKVKDKKINILACFIFPTLLIGYPILNEAHLKEIVILQYLLVVSILYIIFHTTIMKKEKIKKILIISAINVLLVNSMVRTIFYINRVNQEELKYNNPYYGSLFGRDIYIKIDKVTKYINNCNKRVIIITPDAAFYTIPLKQCNGKFDLLLYGNLGKKGEDGIIQELKTLKDERILMNKEKINYQESDKIRDFIQKNFESIGEIEDLVIYEKRESY